MWMGVLSLARQNGDAIRPLDAFCCSVLHQASNCERASWLHDAPRIVESMLNGGADLIGVDLV